MAPPSRDYESKQASVVPEHLGIQPSQFEQGRADIIELRQNSVPLGALTVLDRYRQGLHELAGLTEHFASIERRPEKHHGLFREMIFAEHVVDERAPTELAHHQPGSARRQ